MTILIEVAPKVWLELSRNHHLFGRLALLAVDGKLSHETLTTLRRHGALTRETDFQIEIFAWDLLRPVVQQLAEEINK
jgi:hypothetical protein